MENKKLANLKFSVIVILFYYLTHYIMADETPENKPRTPGNGDLDLFLDDPEGKGLPESEGSRVTAKIYGDRATGVVDRIEVS